MEAATKDKILSLKPHTHLNIKIERGGGGIYIQVCANKIALYHLLCIALFPGLSCHDICGMTK